MSYFSILYIVWRFKVWNLPDSISHVIWSFLWFKVLMKNKIKNIVWRNLTMIVHIRYYLLVLLHSAVYHTAVRDLNKKIIFLTKVNLNSNVTNYQSGIIKLLKKSFTGKLLEAGCTDFILLIVWHSTIRQVLSLIIGY